MKALSQLSKSELQDRIGELQSQYDALKAKGLKLDMSRGKPCTQQLDLSVELMDVVTSKSDFKAEGGMDTRNYGGLDGIPEAKKLFAEVLGVDSEQVFVGGNASLKLMFDFICYCYTHGFGEAAWKDQKDIKFICPAPGYDRHFAITEYFGIKMIPVAMTETGPDMDEVEKLAADPTVKGMWCVPMYSNPDGITYSDETVRRIAKMKVAPDFRIIWDNAYCIHHVYPEHDKLLNLYDEAKKTGHEDHVIMFTSTSKVTVAGGGISAMACSPAIMAKIKKAFSIQTIGYDKVNMLRHARYFKGVEGLHKHMEKHANVLRPKFDMVLAKLDKHLTGKGVGEWHKPHGGYFVSINLAEGTATETIRLLKEAGVVMTPAGATWPYGKDPKDSNLRIAPSFPPVEELDVAMDLFCICAELAYAKKLA